MVVFTCNNCGETLQKPRVAKHYQFSCRSVPFLTCVDCLKDFRAEEYVAHTKCITEAERYGGKNFVSKPSANKGEKKQQAWINIVQNVLDNSKNLSNSERNLLKTISKHENIPRKKAKFVNFIRNAVGNVPTGVTESTWEKIEAAHKNSMNNTDTKNQELNSNGAVNSNQEKDLKDSTCEEKKETNIAENENNENILKEKKCKHKKKNKSRSDENNESGENDAYTEPIKKKSKKNELSLNGENDTGAEPIKKKSKKKELSESLNGENDAGTEPIKKKSKKRELSVNDTTESLNDTIEEEHTLPKKKCKVTSDDTRADTAQSEIVHEKCAFDWKNTILNIVSSKKEISLNKLQKKVLTQYINHCSDTVPYEKAVSKFNKKLKKISEIVISEEKVRLV